MKPNGVPVSGRMAYEKNIGTLISALETILRGHHKTFILFLADDTPAPGGHVPFEFHSNIDPTVAANIMKTAATRLEKRTETANAS